MAFLNIPAEVVSQSVDDVIKNTGQGGKTVLIPDGKYTGVIVKSELTQTSKGGTMLVVTAVITQGEHRDTEFVDRLNLVNGNETAVKIGYGTLAKIAKAVGLATIPSDSNQLHNKPLQLVIETEKGTSYKDKMTGEERTGRDKSVIGGYEPLPQVGVGGQPAFVAAASGEAKKLPWG